MKIYNIRLKKKKIKKTKYNRKLRLIKLDNIKFFNIN